MTGLGRICSPFLKNKLPRKYRGCSKYSLFLFLFLFLYWLGYITAVRKESIKCYSMQLQGQDPVLVHE